MEGQVVIIERQGVLKTGQDILQIGQTKIQDGQVKIQDDLAKIREAIGEKGPGHSLLILPSTVMPGSPRIFGRQSYIDKAVQLLLSSTSTRIVILGPGGMGKTSVALKIAYDSRVIERFRINRRWIPCEQAASVPLFIELIAKSLGLPPSTSNDRFGEIIAALEESDALHFVLFDNFETLWDLEGEQSTVANILSRLASIPSVSFILTMRGIQHPASDQIDWTSPRLPPLTPLDMDPAQEAFVKISPDSEGDPNLQELLRELDCVPLAITLMAKLAEVGESITELLSQWNLEQVKLLSQPSGDRTNSIDVSIRLSLTSSSVRSNADAIPLLGVLARLPGGASLAQVPTICPSIPGWKAALRVLRTAALVYDSPDKTVVHMLSPIRSYVLLHHPVKGQPLRDLRNAYYKLAGKGYAYHDDSNFVDIMTELSREEINLETIVLDALHSADNKVDAISAALGYSNFLASTQPRINVIETALQTARDTGSHLLPYCLDAYGDTLRLQGQYDAASIALEEARDMYRQRDNKLKAAACLWMIGDMLRVRNKFDEACSRLEEARGLYLESNDISGATDCLWILGEVYEGQGRFDMATSTLEQARTHFVESGHELRPANCLLSLGRVYRAQWLYEAALSAAEEARSEFIRLRHPRETANALWVLSDIHRELGQYSKAYSTADEAKSFYSQLGDKLGIALSLRSMANTLYKQGRYEEAHRHAEEAKEESIKLGDSLGVAVSRRLLGDICRMQGKLDTACFALEEAKSLFTQCKGGWYSSVELADCNKSLGKIYRLEGQYDNAIKLLEEAREIYSTFSSKKSDAAECTEEIELALGARDSCEYGADNPCGG
ncbi:hypothetical protein FRC03_008514 [Tulasnella sp. 419]|nr:hypothetical protein FRC03_008514 [Tulasnella sp. 419]